MTASHPSVSLPARGDTGEAFALLAIPSLLIVIPSVALIDVDVGAALGPRWTWIGWALFAVGVLLVFSMDPKDSPRAVSAAWLRRRPALTMLGLRAAIALGMLVGAAFVRRPPTPGI